VAGEISRRCDDKKANVATKAHGDHVLGESLACPQRKREFTLAGSRISQQSTIRRRARGLSNGWGGARFSLRSFPISIVHVISRDKTANMSAFSDVV
jgi:hypothetical protein